jgi:hypothetical protein
MKTNSLVGLALAAAILSGCVVQSIQPLFTEREYVTYPGLVGAWVQKEDDGKEIGVWTFEASERQYKLAHTDEKGRKAVFNVAAGKIGTNSFFDFSLLDPLPGGELNDLAGAGLIAAHAFVKVVKTNDALLLLAMNYEWLEKHLAENPKAIAHTIQDKRVILTASTAELQGFVARHANDEKAFGNVIKLSPRKKTAN